MSRSADIITRLWPFVVLGSSFTLARMAGHLGARRMFGAMVLIGAGFVYLESISVGTSYYSALHALELKQQAEIARASGSEATELATRAASTAAASLAGNLEAMQGSQNQKKVSRPEGGQMIITKAEKSEAVRSDTSDDQGQTLPVTPLKTGKSSQGTAHEA